EGLSNLRRDLPRGGGGRRREEGVETLQGTGQ
ncbi:hypothetical protein THAOC_09658, partial [Thalassiosira oceanica]